VTKSAGIGSYYEKDNAKSISDSHLSFATTSDFPHSQINCPDDRDAKNRKLLAPIFFFICEGKHRISEPLPSPDVSNHRTTILLLPGGEGRDEGEQASGEAADIPQIANSKKRPINRSQGYSSLLKTPGGPHQKQPFFSMEPCFKKTINRLCETL
jgi:hypothetical protein